MYIKYYHVHGFKNLRNVFIEPDPHYNIIIGDNAQGKTNVIESIYMASGCKSFRGSKYEDCIGLQYQKFTINMAFIDSRREQRITYDVQKEGGEAKKYVLLNRVDVKPTDLFDVFKCIYFTPIDTELIRSGPEKRRSFVDMAACQLNPTFMRHIMKHEKIMDNINTLLKRIMRGIAKYEEIEPWFKQESEVGAMISFMRNDYIKSLNAEAQEIYSRITDGSEVLTVEYRSDAFDPHHFNRPCDDDMKYHYYTRMKMSITHDISKGYTSRGINRDNIIVKINGLSAKDFASQGQIKSAALALKLAQAEIYRRKIKEPPIILLDDVMGELDEKRQRLVYELIRDNQVFITTPNLTSLLTRIDAKIFRMKEGRISLYER